MPVHQHRRLMRTPQPGIAYLPPFSEHDPRAFGRPYDGFRQPDEIALAQAAENAANGVVPFDQVVDDLTAHNLPPQLVQASFLGQITQVGVPGAIRLIPKNPTRRQSFAVSNFLSRSTVLFSYDKPINVGLGNNLGAGIDIGLYYQETNGAVSTNDIWVFCNDPAENYSGFFILGYEGGIALTGNKL